MSYKAQTGTLLYKALHIASTGQFWDQPAVRDIRPISKAIVKVGLIKGI